MQDYDATPHSPQLFGGNPVMPVAITDEYRPFLKRLSQLALKYYNQKEGWGASYQFHDLVKYTFWGDNRRKALFTGHLRPDPTVHYITFQATAKAKGFTSSRPAVKIFQAKISVDKDKDDKDKPPVVEECRIKI